MTWISHIADRDPAEVRSGVVGRSRDLDAIGAALGAVFQRASPLPAEWISALQALDDRDAASSKLTARD